MSPGDLDFLISLAAAISPALAVYVGIRVDIERHAVEIEQLKMHADRAEKRIDQIADREKRN